MLSEHQRTPSTSIIWA